MQIKHGLSAISNKPLAQPFRFILIEFPRSPAMKRELSGYHMHAVLETYAARTHLCMQSARKTLLSHSFSLRCFFFSFVRFHWIISFDFKRWRYMYLTSIIMLVHTNENSTASKRTHSYVYSVL